MSALTKEERELRDWMERSITQPSKCTTHHFACHCMNRRIVDLIDRLSARVEELEQMLLSSKPLYLNLYEESQAQLTALIEAVDGAMFDTFFAEDCGFMFLRIPIDKIDNLNSVVQKIKEGK